MNVMMLMFRTHLGDVGDSCSLERWIADLGKNRNKLWNGSKEMVKDFRSCEDLFELVLDGYLVAALANACEFTDPDNLLLEVSKDPDRISGAIKSLAKYFSQFNEVSRMQQSPPEARDRPFENINMFIQHRLVMRNFKRGMREGDSGRCLASLSYYTVWFQASNQYQYAAETIHLTACLKKYWSPAYRQFFLENCLINPSGKKEGWMATDFFCEWIIGELKAMFPDNVTEQSLEYMRDTISPQVMFFRRVREKMRAETEAVHTGDHSSIVKRTSEVDHIASRVLQEGLWAFKAGRETRESERTDLYGQGLVAIGAGTRLRKYQHHLARQLNLSLGNLNWLFY